MAIVTWMFIIIADTPRVGYLTRLDQFMNLSFGVVFAMSIAHSMNYVLYEMKLAEERKAKAASAAALQTTLEKLAVQQDNLVRRYSMASLPGGEAGTGAPRRRSGSGAATALAAGLATSPVAVPPVDAGSGGASPMSPLSTNGGAPVAAGSSTGAPAGGSANAVLAGSSEFRASMAAARASRTHWLADRICRLPHLMSTAWSKTGLSRKIDIIITCLSAIVYVVATAWIFLWPSSSDSSQHLTSS